MNQSIILLLRAISRYKNKNIWSNINQMVKRQQSHSAGCCFTNYVRHHVFNNNNYFQKVMQTDKSKNTISSKGDSLTVSNTQTAKLIRLYW